MTHDDHHSVWDSEEAADFVRDFCAEAAKVHLCNHAKRSARELMKDCENHPIN